MGDRDEKAWLLLLFLVFAYQVGFLVVYFKNRLADIKGTLADAFSCQRHLPA